MAEPDGLVEGEEKEILGGEVEDYGPIKSEIKNITVIEGIVKKRSRTIYYFASCGHVVHQATDLGGRCGEGNCGAIACKCCTRVCNRCLKILCPKHTKMHNGLSYCSWCKWFVMLRLTQCQSLYELIEEDDT